MLKTPAIATLMLALFAAPAFAQTAPPTAPAPGAPPAATAPTPAPAAGMEMTKDGKPKAKAVRDACRTEAEGEGLKGMAKQKAVSACLVKQRPDLAEKEQCRMDGRAKGLKKDELKAFVKDCAKAKG